jgi:hypothetical protein
MWQRLAEAFGSSAVSRNAPRVFIGTLAAVVLVLAGSSPAGADGFVEIHFGAESVSLTIPNPPCRPTHRTMSCQWELLVGEEPPGVSMAEATGTSGTLTVGYPAFCGVSKPMPWSCRRGGKKSGSAAPSRPARGRTRHRARHRPRPRPSPLSQVPRQPPIRPPPARYRPPLPPHQLLRPTLPCHSLPLPEHR